MRDRVAVRSADVHVQRKALPTEVKSPGFDRLGVAIVRAETLLLQA